MIYTVTFNPAVDYVVHTDGFGADGIARAKKESIFFGGKGINVSRVLHELGVPSVAMGFAAGFTGAAIEQGLREAGLDTRFIHLDSGFSRINVKIKAEKETELNGRGPEIDSRHLDMLLESIDTLEDGDTIVLAGSIPAGVDADIYERILMRLKGRDIRTAVDASGQLLLNVLPCRPWLIKPNDAELAALFGKESITPEEAAGYAAKLQEKGARNVLVSMAEKGALLLDEQGGVHRAAAHKGTPVNSAGAGDSMLAGFIAGISDGYEHALRLGTAAGGATAFSEGLASREDIERLMGIRS